MYFARPRLLSVTPCVGKGRAILGLSVLQHDRSEYADTAVCDQELATSQLLCFAVDVFWFKYRADQNLTVIACSDA